MMEIKSYSFEEAESSENEKEADFELSEKEKEDIIEGLLADLDTKIGEGNSADVYIDENFPDVCFKIISRPADDINSVAEEVRLMQKAGDEISQEWVPYPYFYINATIEDDSGQEWPVNAVVMERIQGGNIEEMIKEKKEIPNAVTPQEKSDLGTIREEKYLKMKEAVKKMNEAGIFHNDLNARNIMIAESGDAYIIDFGKAEQRQILSSEEVPKTDEQTLHRAWMSFLDKAKQEIEQSG